MKRLIAATVFLIVASFLGASVGLAQEASPVKDPSVPEGAIGVDSRVFFKDGLEDIEAVEFMLMTNWHMDSVGAAERFYESLASNVSSDLTVRETSERLLDHNDDQVLVTGEDQFGGPVTIVLFRHDTYVGTWMAVGDVGQDRILADAYNDFFAGGFDPADPFPTEAYLPEGYAPVG